MEDAEEAQLSNGLDQAPVGPAACSSLTARPGEMEDTFCGTEAELTSDDESFLVSTPPPYQSYGSGLQVDYDGHYSSAQATDGGRIDLVLDLQSKHLQRFFDYCSKTKSPVYDDAMAVLPKYQHPRAALQTPALNIVIQIVGSRGDVQPFVSLGCALQKHGHRVRLATHSVFKGFVESHGLEFFNIGGDPTEMMAYMVKNPGLLPKYATLRSGEVQKRRRAISEIMNGCWRSCIEAGDGLDSKNSTLSRSPTAKDARPFVADAIIANPPSFAHIHCAEKLSIPLHIMFTMPWSPTGTLTHPLVNVRSSGTEAKIANYLSYILVEMLMWQGLGDIIGSFRRKTLDLEPIDSTWAPVMIDRLRIPHTYCWSPKLIRKPRDWASHITIAGFFSLSSAGQYTPPSNLSHFLASGPTPVYIGFGSIVIDDPAALTALIFSAVRLTGVRAIVSKGWGSIGDPTDIPPGIFMLEDCPHDWLFEHVSCVIHHGGAGTTATGIAAGKPTVVVPFFADQPFWGDVIHRAGAGPRPIPFTNLTVEALAKAIRAALMPEVLENARMLGEMIQLENGKEEGVKSFHKHLPMEMMKCDLLPGKAAVWQLRKGKNIIQLSALAATALRKQGLIDFGKLKLHRSSVYNLDHGPWEPISGSTMSIVGLFTETFKGIGEIGSEFTHIPYFGYKGKGKGKAIAQQGQPSVERCTLTSPSQYPTSSHFPILMAEQQHDDKYEKTIVGVRAAKGLGRIFKAALRSPMTFTVAMAKGTDNLMKLMGDETVRPQQKITGTRNGLAAAGKGFALNTVDGLTGLITQPHDGFIDGGIVGGVKGLARGIICLPLKWWSGSNGLVGYSLKGMDADIKALAKVDTTARIKSSRAIQGEWEFAEAEQEVLEGIVERWRSIDLRSL